MPGRSLAPVEESLGAFDHKEEFRSRLDRNTYLGCGAGRFGMEVCGCQDSIRLASAAQEATSGPRRGSHDWDRIRGECGR